MSTPKPDHQQLDLGSTALYMFDMHDEFLTPVHAYQNSGSHPNATPAINGNSSTATTPASAALQHQHLPYDSSSMTGVVSTGESPLSSAMTSPLTPAGYSVHSNFTTIAAAAAAAAMMDPNSLIFYSGNTNTMTTEEILYASRQLSSQDESSLQAAAAAAVDQQHLSRDKDYTISPLVVEPHFGAGAGGAPSSPGQQEDHLSKHQHYQAIHHQQSSKQQQQNHNFYGTSANTGQHHSLASSRFENISSTASTSSVSQQQVSDSFIPLHNYPTSLVGGDYSPNTAVGSPCTPNSSVSSSFCDPKALALTSCTTSTSLETDIDDHVSTMSSHLHSPRAQSSFDEHNKENLLSSVSVPELNSVYLNEAAALYESKIETIKINTRKRKSDVSDEIHAKKRVASNSASKGRGRKAKSVSGSSSTVTVAAPAKLTPSASTSASSFDSTPSRSTKKKTVVVISPQDTPSETKESQSDDENSKSCVQRTKRTASTASSRKASPKECTSANENASATTTESGNSRRGRRATASDEDVSKAFVCDECNRRFRRQEHLKRHYRSLHTREKPFECDKCAKRFSRSDNLTQHARTHNRGPQYSGSGDGDADSSDGPSPTPILMPPTPAPTKKGRRAAAA